jgi:hypothetical protein
MRKKLIILFAISSVAVLLLAAAVAFTQGWFPGKHTNEEAAVTMDGVMDETETGIALDDDPWQEMEKLVNAYYANGKDQVQYSGKMILTDDSDEEGKVLEEQAFDYAFCKGDYYYKIGLYECVGKEKFILMADHQFKNISISEVSPGSGTPEQALDMAGYSKLLQQQNAVVKLVQTASGRVLTIDKIQDASIQGFSIYYDPATYRVQKIVVGMLRFNPVQETTDEENADTNEEEKEEDSLQGYLYKLTISYDRINVIAGSTPFRPENKFIRIVNDKMELAPEYREYELMN